MIQSMTGFASGQGAAEGYRWTWELRSVNGRGLDLRLRVPDWIEGLEPSLRSVLSKSASRGNITLNLRVQREDNSGDLRLNFRQLDKVVIAMSEIEATLKDAGVSLAPAKATDVMTLRGVLEQSAEPENTAALKTAIEAELPGLVDSFLAMRKTEGEALRHILATQLHEVAKLTQKASEILTARQEEAAATLKRNLAKVLDGVAEIDEGRVAQELALIAVKSDVTEEIDRLKAHVAAALELLENGGGVGRKLDFLMQEFNREANTLCSKAQMKELTEVGLALKVVIDQMREQVQNVE